ncbi:alkaline phosphatase family protein [Fodinicola feengrottensis]|uniref:phospholipase C n=1 Tax=Fodinicola feengrottensis TaxID=435914 RepID=A0ABN2ISA4_9ACTN
MASFTRRQVLASGLVSAMAGFGSLSASARSALASVARPGSRLSDIEHVVILMQENRSFDHYFGTLSGVAGFDDPLVPRDWRTGRTAFEQLDPSAQDGANGLLLPWHLPVATSSAHCLTDVSHTWQVQHQSMNGGKNDTWVSSHVTPDTQIAKVSDHPAAIVNGGARVMSYFTRDDLPFHYALADTFTVCDRYFCSVIGPTIPNRLYLMSASIDPAATHGGPGINNFKNGFSWTTYPERLQAAGIDWRLYREGDDFGDNMLDHFAAYQDRTSDLFRRGRTVLASGKVPNILSQDVQNGNLPQVSWIVGPSWSTEHPEYMPAGGAYFLQQVLEALTSNTAVWQKTLLIVTYDENGGFFDHVRAPQAPRGTPGEYLTPAALATTPEAAGIAGPIGLGPRVPTMLISPFTRGGLVSSHTYDHTSVLRLLETRFGVEVPNLTHWRRATCGDLVEAINFAGTPRPTLPTLPDTAALLREAVEECKTQPPPQVPVEQVMPRQEHGFRRRPSGPIF